MRILLVEGSGRGFLSHYAHALARGLDHAGHQVRLLTGLRDELADWPRRFEKRACLKGGWASWRCLAREVRSMDAQVVHLQWIDKPTAALWFIRWARRRGVKVVYTPHNILPHERRWITMPVYRLIYSLVDRIVVRDGHIGWALEELLGISRRQLAMIPGSPNLLGMPDMPVRQLAGLPQRQEGETRLLYFGHGSRRKGLDQLVDWMSSRDWPDHVPLVIAGEGVTDRIHRDKLDELRRHLRLTLHEGYVPPESVSALFRSADCLLMPYIKQCKSPLLDLAAAFSLPVLKSERVKGIGFREGVHGLTLHHEDTASWLSTLQVMVNQREQLQAMQQAMHKGDGVLASLIWLAKRHHQLYRELIDPVSAVEQVGVFGHEGAW